MSSHCLVVRTFFSVKYAVSHDVCSIFPFSLFDGDPFFILITAVHVCWSRPDQNVSWVLCNMLTKKTNVCCQHA